MTKAQIHALNSASGLLGRELTLVEAFTGGQHATTLLATDGALGTGGTGGGEPSGGEPTERGAEFVIRAFPPHHDAAIREADVLGRLASLGDWVPQLIAFSSDLNDPVIVTTRAPGSTPDPATPLTTIAAEMAEALVRIHDLDGTGLRPTPEAPPRGDSALARRAQLEWKELDTVDTVLTHSDFWSGNALWEDDRLTGVVDWSGARCGPRGVDLAWCRQDLVLLGSHEAAEVFLVEYERRLGRQISDINAWDVQAAALAHDRVETWLPNYLGIGLTNMTSELLRSRLDEWNATL